MIIRKNKACNRRKSRFFMNVIEKIEELRKDCA